MTRPDNSSTARPFLVGAFALLVAIGAAAVVASIVDTADARFAGSTDNRGSLLGAGEVELELVTDGGPGASEDSEIQELAIEARNVVPGETIERCVVVAYSGSVDDVDLRLYGRIEEGGGLEAFLDTRFEVGAGFDPTCADFTLPAADPVTWSGTLADFGTDRDSYATAIPVLESASSESTATLRTELTLLPDNRAQGLATSFWLVLEVRP